MSERRPLTRKGQPWRFSITPTSFEDGQYSYAIMHNQCGAETVIKADEFEDAWQDHMERQHGDGDEHRPEEKF